MDATLVVLRRTTREIAIFGGEVYLDVDGKNIGLIGKQDFFYKLEPGRHVLKMYKSHSYGSMIGIAEVTLEIRPGRPLLARYVTPMTVNQPGHIQICDYSSSVQADQMAHEVEMQLLRDAEKDRKDAEKIERSGKRSLRIFWICTIASAVLFIISMIIIQATTNQRIREIYNIFS